MEGVPRPAPKESAPRTESLEVEKVDSVVTAKGSTYRYLPDGTTQRFKEVEGREYPPQSALVYVPNYEWVKKHAPKDVFEKLGENEAIYTETLLEYVQNPRKDGRKVYIVDRSGKVIETNAEIRNAEGPVFLNFLKDGKPEFAIPVSHTPKLGFLTFDTRRYVDPQTGEAMRERHLGNAVIKIIPRD